MAAELGADADALRLHRRRDRRPCCGRCWKQLPIELRLVETGAASGAYLHDRRSGERVPLAQSASLPPSRHEIDDLFSVACAAALDADVLALCGPYPGEALPLEIYGNLVADVRANGTPVVVDLSPPRLDSALEGKPDLVKINDWELAKFVEGPVDGEARMRAATERLLEAGAGAAIVTRAEQPALVLRGDEAWELVPPRFERGAREGCGDSMMGGLAACMASGRRAGRRRCGSAPPPAPPTSSATASAAPTAPWSTTSPAGSSCARSSRLRTRSGAIHI